MFNLAETTSSIEHDLNAAGKLSSQSTYLSISNPFTGLFQDDWKIS